MVPYNGLDQNNYGAIQHLFWLAAKTIGIAT